MSKNITNTLSRWHKVAERLKMAVNENRQEAISALQAGASIDLDTFTVRGDSLLANASAALAGGAESVLRLQGALFYVRKEVARANIEFKVSDLLNDMELAKQELNFWEECLATAADKLSADEMKNLSLLRKAQPAPQSVYGHGHERFSVNLISAESLTGLKSRRDAARRRVNTLADDISNANASKLTLALDDTVVALLGLSAD
jgi:hypothetical protein